ncbi:MAG: glycosyltransferase family 4 protein, partial [Ardenticatenaceae bacterium]
SAREVSPTAGSPATELGGIKGERTPSLLFFGFVRPYKGVELLFEAMPQVLRALPQAHLTVAGEWWGAAGDPQQLLSPEIEHAVTIINRYISNEEMATLFEKADVVVLPYRSATQSGVVQLAYGFGVPVITTTVGGLPEAVQHQQSGLLVPPNDPEALANAIIRYHQDAWRARLAEGVEAARKRFSWQAMVEALEGLKNM